MMENPEDPSAVRLEAIADEVAIAEEELTSMIDTGLAMPNENFDQERWLAIQSALEEQMNIRVKRWSFDDNDAKVTIHYEVL